MEREKNKVDQRLKYFIENNAEENSASNNELTKTIQQETENLKELSRNYEKKINEKKEFQRNLEIEMKNIENNERRKYDIYNQNEIKIRHLENQLNDNIEELKRKNYPIKTALKKEPNIFISNNYSLEDSQEFRQNNNKNPYRYNSNFANSQDELSNLSAVRGDMTNYDSIIENKNQTNFFSRDETYFVNSTKANTNYSKKY